MFLIMRKALNQVVGLSKGYAHSRLRVFAWGVFAWAFLRIAWVFLRISAYCCRLLSYTISIRKVVYAIFIFRIGITSRGFG